MLGINNKIFKGLYFSLGTWSSRKTIIWISASFLAVVAFSVLTIIKPSLELHYSAEQLSDKNTKGAIAENFTDQKKDGSGSTYTLASYPATIRFNFAIQQPVTFTLELQGSTTITTQIAIAGDVTKLPPKSPYQLLIKTITNPSSRTPDTDPNFYQPFSIEFNSDPPLAQPLHTPGDAVHLWSVKLDLRQYWTDFKPSLWLVWFVPLGLLIALSLALAYQRSSVIVLSYISIAMAFVPTISMIILLFMAQLGLTPFAGTLRYLIIMAAILYLALFSTAVGLSLPVKTTGNLYRPAYQFIKNQENNLLFFWIGGLVLLVLIMGKQVLSSTVYKQYTLEQYVLLGTGFPLLLVGIKLLGHWPRVASVLLALKLGLSGLVVFISLAFLLEHSQFQLLLIMILSLVQIGIIRSQAKPISQINNISRVLWYVTASLVIALVWTLAFLYIWWTDYIVWIGASNYKSVAVVLVVLLVSLVIFDRLDTSTTAFSLFSNFNLAGVIIIIALNFRTERLYDSYLYYHSNVFVGPAEMVRAGGWLLWDVPAQYGFLNTLLIAGFPSQTSWQALFILNSLLNALVGVSIFLAVRLLGKNWQNWLIGLLVAIASNYKTQQGEGVGSIWGMDRYPAGGGLRFIWCFVLLATLAVEYNRTKRQVSSTYLLWLGTAAWLVGVFWSAESAVYSTAIWLPAYGLLVWRKFSPRWMIDQEKRRLWIAKLMGWLLLPIGLLGLTVAGLSFYYLGQLGNTPDWLSFIDYAVSFSSSDAPTKEGDISLLIDPRGIFWLLLVLLVLISIVCFYFLSKSWKHPALSLAVGLFGATWSVTSYFLARSYVSIAPTLFSVYCMAIALTIYLLKAENVQAKWATLIKLSYVPILSVVILSLVANQGGLIDFFTQKEGTYTRVEDNLPKLDEPTQKLLDKAGVRPDDPIITVSGFNLLNAQTKTNQMSSFVNGKPWLPIYPETLILPLPEERRQVYLERYAQQLKMSGWVLGSVYQAVNDKDWFYLTMPHYYRPTKVVQSEQGSLLTWYEYNPARALANSRYDFMARADDGQVSNNKPVSNSPNQKGAFVTRSGIKAFAIVAGYNYSFNDVTIEPKDRLVFSPALYYDKSRAKGAEVYIEVSTGNETRRIFQKELAATDQVPDLHNFEVSLDDFTNQTVTIHFGVDVPAGVKPAESNWVSFFQAGVFRP